MPTQPQCRVYTKRVAKPKQTNIANPTFYTLPPKLWQLVAYPLPNCTPLDRLLCLFVGIKVHVAWVKVQVARVVRACLVAMVLSPFDLQHSE
jgi:hypothetical protein